MSFNNTLWSSLWRNNLWRNNLLRNSLRKSCRRFFSRPSRLPEPPSSLKNVDLSFLKTDEQLILVCGDSTLFFADKPSLHVTHCGGYLNTPTPDEFNETIKWIAATEPLKLRHLSVMFCLAPEYHADEDGLRAALCQWRTCFFDTHHETNAALPIMLCVCVDPPLKHPSSTNPQFANTWFVNDGFVDSSKSDIKVYRAKRAHIKFTAWQKEQGNNAEIFTQTLWLNRLFGWIDSVVMNELQPVQSGLPFTPLSAVAIHFASLNAVENNIWQCAICQNTTLYRRETEFHSAALPFPDLVLPLILPRRQWTPNQKRSLKSAGMVVVALTIMMQISSCHNGQLIRDFADDIQKYQKLRPEPVKAKLYAQNRLIYNEELLNRYQRYGVPFHLGFGLYQGRSLYMPLQRAINNWTAPPVFYSPTKPDPYPDCQRIFRFPNVSIFKAGESRINAAALPALQKALLKIRYESCGKIQITGHTDSSGDKRENRQLSLKRAEAVRDWMIINSNFPRNSFIVQGMGASQSLKYNDTAEGRAANRRIEIDLVR